MKWRRLPGEEDYLLAPVRAHMCSYESLIDGTLDLADVALMNDFLAVRSDNEWLDHNRKRKE